MTRRSIPRCGSDVLGKTRAFIGGWAIALSWKDSVAKRGGSYFEEGGQDPHYHKLYFEKYIKLDPFTTTQFVAEIGEPKSFLEVMPYAELIQTRIYQEWAQPQGIVDALMCLVDIALENFEREDERASARRHPLNEHGRFRAD
jgi:hypothetical protein